MAIGLGNRKHNEHSAAARPAYVRARRGVIQCAVRCTYEPLPFHIEKVAVLPVQFRSPMRTAVEIGMHYTAMAHHKRRRQLPRAPHRETHPYPTLYGRVTLTNGFHRLPLPSGR